MVYAAYGVSGLTAIVGTFFVKDYLDLSPAFLAALLFWAGIPWALKMPVGHVVDLIWRWKALLVWLGAAMIAASLLIMIGLISHTEAMRGGDERSSSWFVLSALLAPTGYMIQDSVADAMTVEAVPRVDEHGKPYDEKTRKAMHTTMQTLGRVALIGGLALVAAANVYVFHDTGRAVEGAEGRPVRQRLHRGAGHPGDLGARRDPAPLPQARARATVEKTQPELGGARRQPGVRRHHARGRPRRRAVRRGADFRRLARDHPVPAVAPGARARAGGAQHAGGDRARAVPLPRDAAHRRRRHLVDDRRAQVRRGVPRPALARSPTR